MPPQDGTPGPARVPGWVSGGPTCKHRGAVGIADVGVRRVDILREEDEDSQHREAGGAGSRSPQERGGLG